PLGNDAGDATKSILTRARELRINRPVRGNGPRCVSMEEITTRGDLKPVWKTLVQDGATLHSDYALCSETGALYPADPTRGSKFMTHPVFNTHHSEHEMLRYMRALVDKNLAMDRTMIPLGSCTMKLNATAEMIPITWPEFANIHPLAPDDQVAGYHQLINELEAMLAE